MSQPDQSRSCLCPDGMKPGKDADGRDTCLCPNEQPSIDGTCPTGNTNSFLIPIIMVDVVLSDMGAGKPLPPPPQRFIGLLIG